MIVAAMAGADSTDAARTQGAWRATREGARTPLAGAIGSTGKDAGSVACNRTRATQDAARRAESKPASAARDRSEIRDELSLGAVAAEKRITTMPPASTPVTTPSPKAGCATSSPMRKAGLGRPPATRRCRRRNRRRRGRRRRFPTAPRPTRRLAHARCRRRRRPVATIGQVLVGDPSRKRAAQPVRACAEDRAGAGERDVEVALGARDADVRQATLLQAALLDRARVWKDALLTAEDEDDRVPGPWRCGASSA